MNTPAKRRQLLLAPHRSRLECLCEEAGAIFPFPVLSVSSIPFNSFETPDSKVVARPEAFINHFLEVRGDSLPFAEGPGLWALLGAAVGAWERLWVM
jgi:hypothetical protein